VQNRIYLGMSTLKELIVKRPCMKLEFLEVLLDFTSHEKGEVRSNAIRVTKKLHERSDLKSAIEVKQTLPALAATTVVTVCSVGICW